MSNAQEAPISLRPAGPLRAALAERSANGNAATAQLIRRDLERYYATLAAELSAIHLSRGEAMLIVDACNGTLFEAHSVRLLWAEIDDAVRSDGLDRKWDVDGVALVQQLRGLSYAQALAVVDGAERFAQAVGRGESPTVESVGLVQEATKK